MTKKKNNKWFIKVRGSYLPNSWQACLAYIPFTAFLTMVLAYAYDNASTAAEAIIITFPTFVASAVVMTWIAKQKS